ncbi:mitochondrial import protein Pam17-domain-containing protein [Zopfochytrium polystomum]|nr:mitochondrial import protein Pam17-domain-containing protein [Zopfochytrium polystomum]
MSPATVRSSSTALLLVVVGPGVIPVAKTSAAAAAAAATAAAPAAAAAASLLPMRGIVSSCSLRTPRQPSHSPSTATAAPANALVRSHCHNQIHRLSSPAPPSIPSWHSRLFSASSPAAFSAPSRNSPLFRKPASRPAAAAAEPQTAKSASSPSSSSSASSTARAKGGSGPSSKAAAASSSPLSPSGVLTWTEYFRIRRAIRVGERTGAGIGGGVGFLASSYYFMAVIDFDPNPIFGVDPSLIYAAAIFGIGFASAAAGTLAGAAGTRAAQGSSVLRAVDQREREFFERVKSVRPADVRMSLQNPLPDYYAEKVTSLQDYRAWLRKQREYRIKTEGFKYAKTTFKGRVSLRRTQQPVSVLRSAI